MGSAPCCFKGIRRIGEQRLGNGLKDIVVVDKFAVLLDSLISKKGGHDDCFNSST